MIVNPKPCTLHYITQTCKFGSDCPYGHDYDLGLDQIEEIRGNAKRSPCVSVNRGEEIRLSPVTYPLTQESSVAWGYRRRVRLG